MVAPRCLATQMSAHSCTLIWLASSTTRYCTAAQSPFCTFLITQWSAVSQPIWKFLHARWVLAMQFTTLPSALSWATIMRAQ